LANIKKNFKNMNS